MPCTMPLMIGFDRSKKLTESTDCCFSFHLANSAFGLSIECLLGSYYHLKIGICCSEKALECLVTPLSYTKITSHLIEHARDWIGSCVFPPIVAGEDFVLHNQAGRIGEQGKFTGLPLVLPADGDPISRYKVLSSSWPSCPRGDISAYCVASGSTSGAEMWC